MVRTRARGEGGVSCPEDGPAAWSQLEPSIGGVTPIGGAVAERLGGNDSWERSSLNGNFRRSAISGCHGCPERTKACLFRRNTRHDCQRLPHPASSRFNVIRYRDAERQSRDAHPRSPCSRGRRRRLEYRKGSHHPRALQEAQIQAYLHPWSNVDEQA